MNTMLILAHSENSSMRTASVLAKQLEESNLRIVTVDIRQLLGASAPSGRISRGIWQIKCGLCQCKSAKLPLFRKLYAKLLTKGLLRLVRHEDPTAIVSLYQDINPPILDVLENYNLSIPYIALIDELISFSNIHIDKRICYVLVSTDEAEQIYHIYGFPSSKVKNFGYPIPQGSSTSGDSDIIQKEFGVFTCFMEVQDTGFHGEMGGVIKKLLHSDHYKLKIMAPDTGQTFSRLKKLVGEEHLHHATLYDNSDDRYAIMRSCDFAILSPATTTIMECVANNLPIILLGSNKKTTDYSYFLSNNSLGITCNHTADILYYIQKLYRDNAKLLRTIKKNQVYYIQKYGNGAERMSHFLLAFLESCAGNKNCRSDNPLISDVMTFH